MRWAPARFLLHRELIVTALAVVAIPLAPTPDGPLGPISHVNRSVSEKRAIDITFLTQQLFIQVDVAFYLGSSWIAFLLLFQGFIPILQKCRTDYVLYKIAGQKLFQVDS